MTKPKPKEVESEVSTLEKYWRRDPELSKRLDDFEAFVKTMKLQTREYEPDDNEDPNDFILKGKTYQTCETPDGQWSYNPQPCFNDFNIEYGDEITGFGVRSDDDFFVEARLPYKFEEIPIEFIVRSLWPKIKKPKYKPGSHWFHGQQYIKLCEALGTEAIHRIIEDHDKKKKH